MGIVLHPGEAVARRKTMDEAGVVHEHTQVLLGEAMERGPIMLSWEHVANAAENTARGHNVVVHEFVHKLDMKSGEPNGCPPLPAGFMGARTGRAAYEAWWNAWEPAYRALPRSASSRPSASAQNAPGWTPTGPHHSPSFLRWPARRTL